MPNLLRYALIGILFGCANDRESQPQIVRADSILSAADSVVKPTTKAGSIPPPSDSAVKQTALMLSEPMRKALDAFAPGFALFGANEFTPQVMSYATADRKQLLNRAAGDFNGDGVPDLALFGRDKTRELILVLLSMPDGKYTAFPLKEQQIVSEHNHDLSIYLTTAQPGKLDIPEELARLDSPLPPKTLPHGGINIIYDGQAGELFYWNGSRFLLVTTGD